MCISKKSVAQAGIGTHEGQVANSRRILSRCNLQHKTADGKGSRNVEQTSFSAEDESVKKPVAIPRDVLATLSNDELVKGVLEEEDIRAEKMPASWFSASAIHLSNGREVDLIVMSVGPVHGANVTMFWGFRPRASGHELIFRAGGHSLEVRNTRWHGYRDIETWAVTMQKASTVLYRFDGKKYTRYKDRLEEIR